VEDLGLVGDLAVVAVAATIGGVIARVLRLPTLVGYLLAGLAIGPHTPGIVGDIEQTQTIADLGVALLMFTLGIRFSLRQLLEMRQLALLGGITQVVTVLAVGAALGALLGLGWKEALVLGMVASISSTMLALRVLEQRGQIDSIAGRVGVTFALTQDLAVVVLLAVIPLLGESDQSVLVAIPLAVGKAALFLLGAALLGPLLVPRLLAAVALSRSRELFILAIVALALGTASVSGLAGLSLAFGAFLAGLVISESEYAHQTLTNVIPLREIFAVVFFVAVGMLIDPGAAFDDPELVVAMLVAGVVLKALFIGGASRAFGYPALASATAALALANTGEFSFIITEAAADEGIAGERLVASMLAAVFISLALGAPLVGLDTRIAPLVGAMPSPIGRETAAAAAVAPEEQPAWVNHVVICGYEEGAQELMSVLSGREFRYMVIDEDPLIVRRLRETGVRCILGDPSLRSILEEASVERARVLAVTLSNTNQAEDVVREARAINPRLDVIARGAGRESHFRLRELGASAVVHPGLELGIEFARHSLHRFGLTSQEIAAITAGRRRRYSE
jgi:CPA2 family monovalent cation:H+ antiporter-2